MFGNWSTAFRRFRDWREADVFKRIFDALSEEPDMEYAMIDATIVKVHRHGQDEKGGLRARPLAVPKAAMATKILAPTDALGNLVRFQLMSGHRFDAVGVAPLFEGVEFGALLAAKACDSNDIIAELNERGAKIVVSQHPHRVIPIPLDAVMYKWRHLIENFFCNSRSSSASPCAHAKQTAASNPSSTSLRPSWPQCIIDGMDAPGRNRGIIAVPIMALWERQMTEITSVGLDIAKNWFQVHGAEDRQRGCRSDLRGTSPCGHPRRRGEEPGPTGGARCPPRA
jgi:transposase